MRRIVPARVMAESCAGRLAVSAGLMPNYGPSGMAWPGAPLPYGYAITERSRIVGTGLQDFQRIGTALMSWEIHRAAGFCIRPESEVVVSGSAVAVALPLGHAVAIIGICRVVDIRTDPGVTGFAYGSLPGHPQRGEEAFWVTHDEVTGDVRLHVRAVTAPAAWFTTVAGRVATAVQARAVDRFLGAGRGLLNGAG